MYCFKVYKNGWNCEQTFTLGNKFMPELDLKQPGFTCSACGPFNSNKERIENFRQTGITDFIYGKTCFQRNMSLGKSKDLAKITQSDKVL